MKRESPQLDDPPDLRKRGKNNDDACCTEEDTTHRSSEGMSSVPVLEPKHKIFLSHSGDQKEFVDHLCEALERRCHYPFYDRRWMSLPKGERFPPLILKAAKQCEMAVVVVSQEYFMSKWPMIELNAFVQAVRQKSNSKLKILPLFYGLSVGEFREERRRERWYEQWEVFAKDNAQGRIKVDEWKDALDMLGSFNGIQYNRESKESVAYKNVIVSSICKSSRADIKWVDSHVQGKSNMCEVVCRKIQQIEPSHMYNVKVVGVYGVGGIGKTTMCKTLCNEMMDEYEGQVCHIEFESKSAISKGLLEKVLVRLTTRSLKDVQEWNEDECISIFRQTLQRQRTFLALDNVWDDCKSIDQAEMFLKSPFHEGSLVMVTSRSQKTLELLGIDGNASFEVPDLGRGDAMKLFLDHAGGGKEFAKEEEKRDILECISRCYFSKGCRQGGHYHPLALRALGSLLRRRGRKPSEWVKNLFRVKDFSYSGENPVFGILRSSFDLLEAHEQILFVDVVFYRPRFDLWSGWCYDLMEWLCLVYKQDEAEMIYQLDVLKGRGLLQDVDMKSGEISMHDLYREFAELEVRGKWDESRDVESRKWAYVENGDLSELGSGHKLERLRLQAKCGYNVTGNLERIDWQNCSKLVVVKLKGNFRWTGGAFNLEPLKCLRSFELCDVYGVEGVEGLEGLKYLTYFRWIESRGLHRRGEVQTRMGRFPASLVILEISDDAVLIGQDVLAWCTKLCRLELWSIEADKLDLSSCSSLQSVSLGNSGFLSGLTAPTACGIKILKVKYYEELVGKAGLEQFVGLERLEIFACSSMAVLHLDLRKLTKLQVLEIGGYQFPSLGLPLQLLELYLGPWFCPYQRNALLEVPKAV